MTSKLNRIAAGCGTALLLAGLAAEAPAACAQWRMPGNFLIEQSNGAKAQCTIVSRGNTQRFRGTCGSRGTAGEASGSIEGDRFQMDVKWGNGSVGVYTASLQGERGDTRARPVDGRTFDQTHPARWAIWSSPTRLSCRTG
jgi:hypothetical protein